MTSYPARSVSPWLYEIPTSARPDMRVPARVYADAGLWQQIGRDRSLEQLLNVATLPGIAGFAYAMPDAHEGYGFPVGGVAAFRTSDGVISPGGVGGGLDCAARAPCPPSAGPWCTAPAGRPRRAPGAAVRCPSRSPSSTVCSSAARGISP